MCITRYLPCAVVHSSSIFGVMETSFCSTVAFLSVANTWMKNEIGHEPEVIDPLLKDAACEIIKGIIAGVIYVGIEKPTIREKVKADSVEVEETFTAGSRDISQYEQIAKAYINSLGLKGRGFAFGVYRG